MGQLIINGNIIATFEEPTTAIINGNDRALMQVRNEVTLNGVSSKTIRGLLIQSLPPISKPLMRTAVEEIDGRNGDIVTRLGYSAYDKEVLIGLYGNFDIDAVIAFFDSEGIVTFSNEPDKYYNYQINEQIDFERLIRFRTATVTFHVQPFKYEVGEVPIEETNASSVTVTNKGNYTAKPTITVTGTGTINLSLNGNQIMVIEMGATEDFITIDAAKMEAFNGNTLLNRKVTGSYDNLTLQKGNNTLSWTGSVTSVEITNYSRWI